VAVNGKLVSLRIGELLVGFDEVVAVRGGGEGSSISAAR
jgi:hypothetical protein